MCLCTPLMRRVLLRRGGILGPHIVLLGVQRFRVRLVVWIRVRLVSSANEPSYLIYSRSAT